MKKQSKLALASALLLTTAFAQAASCLEQAGPVVTLSGVSTGSYDRRDDFIDATKLDARNASWEGINYHPVRIGGGDQICFSGGSIQGKWNPLLTSWATYHDTYAFTIFGNAMTVENLRVDNYGDAFNVRNDPDTGHNFNVLGAHVTNNHDDCFQNDSMKSGSITDSLFDGCYNFYSSRGYGSGPNNLVRIENNLVRLQGFPTYYGGPDTGVSDPSTHRHGGFWKIDEFDKAPKLAIHNNIFRLEADSRSWIPLMPDARSIGSCSNNVIVWLGSGPFPEKVPACFRVTTDKSVWDNAVANWKSRRGQPTPVTPPPVVVTPPPVIVTPPPVIVTPAPTASVPVTKITSPANGSFVNRSTRVTIAATASDDKKIVRVRIYINGAWKCTDNSAPYSCSWSVPSKAGVVYKLESKAYDENGNVGSSIVNVTSK